MSRRRKEAKFSSLKGSFVLNFSTRPKWLFVEAETGLCHAHLGVLNYCCENAAVIYSCCCCRAQPLGKASVCVGRLAEEDGRRKRPLLLMTLIDAVRFAYVAAEGGTVRSAYVAAASRTVRSTHR